MKIPKSFTILSIFLTLVSLVIAAEDDGVILGIGDNILIPVLRNDGDILASTLLISANASHGVLTITNGAVLYEHTGPATGTDQFSYQVKNSANVLETAIVNLTISDASRLPATTLAFPPTPPANSYSAEIAFPNIRIQSPTAIASPPGDSKRLFVTQLIGRVLLIPDAGNASSTLINSLELKLLVNSRPEETFQDIGGRGLLSLAFHPSFSTNRQLFISYTVEINGLTYERLSRFLMSETSPNFVDPTSETVFIELEQTALPNSHTGGDLHFGPDGYLYMSWGDEGGDNDAHNNGQKLNQDFWSSIMRIDVEKRPDNVEPNPHPAIKLDELNKAYYSVPSDNPFFTPPNTPVDVRTEFFAIGFRNPWRFTFDQLTGRLIVGDVGQNAREEISIVNKGENHGWPYFEGDISGPKSVPPGNTSVFTSPTYAYPHSPRKSVTGGIVYRGDHIANLYGKYLFCDYVIGDIWAIDLDIGASSLERLTGEAGIVSMGINPSNKDILFVDYHDRLIRRLVVTTPNNTLPLTLSQTGLFADLSTLEANPGIIPYGVNLPFWSDHADKQRWFSIPNGVDTVGFNKDAPWTFPSGMVWIKHFDLEATRGDPSTSKRIETRAFVKTDDSAYGVSYRWNEEGTEAFLVGDEGVEFNIDIIEDSVSSTQHWQIPSRAQCMSCHNTQAGFSLSFNTRQLNHHGQLGGVLGNYIDLLHTKGYLTELLAKPATMPRYAQANESDYTLGVRARSYLDVNCSFCHQPNGNTPVDFDTRAHLQLFASGMVNGAPTRESHHGDDRLLVPGLSIRSIIPSRMSEENGYSRMPPFGSSVVDKAGVQLIRDWIEHELPNHQTYDEWRITQFGDSTSFEGRAEFDADADGCSNNYEFLTNTDPLSISDHYKPDMYFSRGLTVINRPNFSHRRVFVETSTDLFSWKSWNIPNNTGMPLAPSSANASAWQATNSDKARFFRLNISEE
jgi:uncharacterized repeat protein (TIGR03806 family)